MAIRCSIFGHTWADPEVEREREERGTEVVVTARELRTCTRCGKAELLSESTEVTAAKRASSETNGETESSDLEQSDPPVREQSDPAVIGDKPEIVDDGIILTDDEPGRWSAEWPDPALHEEDDPAPDPTPWPEVEQPEPVERGRDAGDVFRRTESVASDTEKIGEPVDPADALSEAAAEQGRTPDFDGRDEVVSGQPGESDFDRQDDAEVLDEELPLEDLVVFCPNCSFVDERPKPSLRGGDSCPACRTSYLRERER